mgnify:CR=1 FL=1
MKLRIGDMVTTSELANSLEEPVCLWAEAPVPWGEGRKVGELEKGATGTVIATHHDDSRSVYLLCNGTMGWALSAMVERYVENPMHQELG